MQVNSNSAINQNVYLNLNQSLNRIATGVELNQSSDNASGLSIANSLLTQSNGYSRLLKMLIQRLLQHRLLQVQQMNNLGFLIM